MTVQNKTACGRVLERRQRAEGRGQKDRLTGDSDSPLNVDHQNKVFGGGFRPKKVEGERTAEPSAFCLCSAASSAFQGGSLGKIVAGNSGAIAPFKVCRTISALWFLPARQKIFLAAQIVGNDR